MDSEFQSFSKIYMLSEQKNFNQTAVDGWNQDLGQFHEDFDNIVNAWVQQGWNVLGCHESVQNRTLVLSAYFTRNA